MSVCVIVKDDQLIGEVFYYPKAGQPHAEVLHYVGGRRRQAQGAAAYVTLEPIVASLWTNLRVLRRFG